MSRPGFTQISSLQSYHFHAGQMPRSLQGKEELLNRVGFYNVAGKPRHMLREVVIGTLRIRNVMLPRQRDDMGSGLCLVTCRHEIPLSQYSNSGLNLHERIKARKTVASPWLPPPSVNNSLKQACLPGIAAFGCLAACQEPAHAVDCLQDILSQPPALPNRG
jgi:hypothetical protein